MFQREDFKGGYGNGSPNIGCNNSYGTQGNSWTGPGGLQSSRKRRWRRQWHILVAVTRTGDQAEAETADYGTNGGGAYWGARGNPYGQPTQMLLGSGGGGELGHDSYGGGRNTIQGNDYVGQAGGAAYVAVRTINS